VLACRNHWLHVKTHGLVPNRIEREILIDAQPDVVWAVVTDPEHVAVWFSDSVDIDLRPGGQAILT
jgi:uncharacterized protein YndB with AHSA1/START domain